MQNSKHEWPASLIARVQAGADGAISFRDFMDACLYDEQFGYYNRDTVKIGKEGDFYTSASIGPFMGMMLAECCLRLRQEEGWGGERWQIVEWGGGTGRLAVQVLDHLQAAAPEAYETINYVLVDGSAYHRVSQQKQLERHASIIRTCSPEEWLRQPSSIAIPTIVCSNELLDAFPVHRLRYKNGRFEELHVAWDETKGAFQDRYIPLTEEPSHTELQRYIEEERLPRREDQLFEVNLAIGPWLSQIRARMNRGAIITIDYGDVREELYASHRMQGTLLCYYRHRAYDNPYVHVGEQDMTAHVNFSAVIRYGEQLGISRWKLQTQREFLIEHGILERLQEHDGADPFGAAARNNRAIRQLLWSDQMSELFKVLVQLI
ncbi:class I SAM-dependent methyltransferase [Paenibacillus koleovorans]|uniref:class I SAM-dependent methyltransferase n=1 Tax=Paenibacillus koleovorans TaxID=121608 RepID=UPI000FD8D565|nr:SAM-dependent methyltransferase [Paenibacillus koleovorans]